MSGIIQVLSSNNIGRRGGYDSDYRIALGYKTMVEDLEAVVRTLPLTDNDKQKLMGPILKFVDVLEEELKF